jgi:hypothetical protein
MPPRRRYSPLKLNDRRFHKPEKREHPDTCKKAEINGIIISTGDRRRIFLGQAIPETGLKRNETKQQKTSPLLPLSLASVLAQGTAPPPLPKRGKG